MKGYKKLLVLFISMFVMCLIPTYKVHAYNRIVYSIYQEGESTFKIKLRWSDFENGNIQITTLAKKDDNFSLINTRITNAKYDKVYDENYNLIAAARVETDADGKPLDPNAIGNSNNALGSCT